MKPQAQVIDLKYRERKRGGRPCGGALYSFFHPNFKENSNPAHVSIPSLARTKQEVPEQKKENQENIDDLTSQKKEIKKEEPLEVKKEDELSRIIKDNYKMMQREIMKEINEYRKVQNYEELNKNNRKVISISQTPEVCPLCGSKLNQGSEEEIYSKAA